jgi:hypothetical protein
MPTRRARLAMLAGAAGTTLALAAPASADPVAAIDGAGKVSVTFAGAESVVLAGDPGGKVELNGADTTIDAAAVKTIEVLEDPAGIGANTVDLSAVSSAAYTQLTSTLIRAAGGADTLTGTQLSVILVVVVLAAYAADRIGIHALVGGFVAGLVVPRHAVVIAALMSRLADVSIVFLLPIFLAYSGLRTDFTTLTWDVLPGIALFVVVAIVAKWGGGLLSGRLGGLTWSESNVLGILMNCRGLMVLVAALIALNAGVISPQMQTGAVVMALVTTAMTGPLVDRFLGRGVKEPVDPVLESA